MNTSTSLATSGMSGASVVLLLYAIKVRYNVEPPPEVVAAIVTVTVGLAHAAHRFMDAFWARLAPKPADGVLVQALLAAKA